METRTENGESERLSAWFAAAAPEPAHAVGLWRLNPHLPRRLLSGITFDVVLADRPLVELAYRILRRYQQPLGPAVLFAGLSSAAVLVPHGTEARWSDLVANSSWPERLSRPICLGRGHTIQVPALSPRLADVAARWLEQPDENLATGRGPLLTSPAPLARCLAEACTLLATGTELTSLRRAVPAGQSALRASQRTW
jgi:hypothetical protein